MRHPRSIPGLFRTSTLHGMLILTLLFGMILFIGFTVEQVLGVSQPPTVEQAPQVAQPTKVLLPPAEVVDPKSCATAGCHTEVKDYEFLHAPTQADACVMCHEPIGKKHEFAPMLPSPQLCTECHESVVTQPNIHIPAEEDCLSCHNPHGSASRKMLQMDTVEETCFTCHEQDIMEKGFKHGPAAVGACTLCHDPHSSKEEKFLRDPVQTLCASCHAEMMDEMRVANYLHQPVKDGCTSCHNPHSGPGPQMLPSTTRELCNKCHEEVVKIADTSLTRHEPAEMDDGCVQCHSPHSSDQSPLLREPQVDLCLSCHDEELRSAEGTLTNMKILLDENKDWHGPVRTGNCGGCHQPHGSDVFRLLKSEYPKKFYSSYDPANYELCFSCHESDLVKDKQTTTLTNFRNGNTNLHFIHVNKEKRGRTCRACHEVHASNNSNHIRESVPYGKWDLPIGFTKSPTGGSCQTGCHEEKKYDRNIFE